MAAKISLSSLLGTFKNAADQGATDLAALRDRIGDCRRRIADAEHAPADSVSIERRAAGLVDGAIAQMRARGGAFNVLALPDARYSTNTASVACEAMTAFEVACMTDREGTIAALAREAVAAGGDAGVKALSETQRKAIIEKLTAEEFGLAASEELLIRELSAAGLNPARRKDALPDVVLAFESELQALADA